ncbi:hypothetical protein AcW1_005645 [Taiwanofungus camphoratus]|nr:hypothetical protein AcW2_004410 [Antrodia cinnamomea]KAI0933974.1 hypothetical protein AcV5_005972 [Antrodia cinnamomea]KAI0957170.1 hypothetical protein AcW1_005645 [Antrodia cinnamomea]
MLYESFQRQEKIIVRIEGSDYFRLTAALDGTFKGLRRGSELALYDLASPSQLLGLDVRKHDSENTRKTYVE